MNQLFGRMRELSIRDLKQRREEIFERTRRMMEADGEEFEESCEYQETRNEKQIEGMEEQSSAVSINSRKKKRQDENNKIRRYWRKMLQVTDYMLEVPDNLRDFYVAARPDGNRCVMIVRNYKLELRDKNGSEIFSCDVKGKSYDKCIFEAYYNKEKQYIVIGDLIVWKDNPMTSSEFEFRHAWLISNVILNNLKLSAKVDVFLIKYYPCNLEGIRQAYSCFFEYQKEGLLFVHKDSFYLHGLNPNVLIWKDAQISKYILAEMQENKHGCKAIGFLNKQGHIKCKENVTLFTVDRKAIDPLHRFVKFSYRNMVIENLEEEGVKVHFEDLKILQTVKNFYGVTDSLGKLLYKCRVGTSMVRIQEIAGRCAQAMQQ